MSQKTYFDLIHVENMLHGQGIFSDCHFLASADFGRKKCDFGVPKGAQIERCWVHSFPATCNKCTELHVFRDSTKIGGEPPGKHSLQFLIQAGLSGSRTMYYLENGWRYRLGYFEAPAVGKGTWSIAVTCRMTSREPTAGAPGCWWPGRGCALQALFYFTCKWKFPFDNRLVTSCYSNQSYDMCK